MSPYERPKDSLSSVNNEDSSLQNVVLNLQIVSRQTPTPVLVRGSRISLDGVRSRASSTCASPGRNEVYAHGTPTVDWYAKTLRSIRFPTATCDTLCAADGTDERAQRMLSLARDGISVLEEREAELLNNFNDATEDDQQETPLALALSQMDLLWWREISSAATISPRPYRLSHVRQVAQGEQKNSKSLAESNEEPKAEASPAIRCFVSPFDGTLTGKLLGQELLLSVRLLNHLCTLPNPRSHLNMARCLKISLGTFRLILRLSMFSLGGQKDGRGGVGEKEDESNGIEIFSLDTDAYKVLLDGLSLLNKVLVKRKHLGHGPLTEKTVDPEAVAAACCLGFAPLCMNLLHALILHPPPEQSVQPSYGDVPHPQHESIAISLFQLLCLFVHPTVRSQISDFASSTCSPTEAAASGELGSQSAPMDFLSWFRSQSPNSPRTSPSSSRRNTIHSSTADIDSRTPTLQTGSPKTPISVSSYHSVGSVPLTERSFPSPSSYCTAPLPTDTSTSTTTLPPSPSRHSSPTLKVTPEVGECGIDLWRPFDGHGWWITGRQGSLSTLEWYRDKEGEWPQVSTAAKTIIRNIGS